MVRGWVGCQGQSEWTLILLHSLLALYILRFGQSLLFYFISGVPVHPIGTLQNPLGARDFIVSCSFDGLSDGQCKGFESRLRPRFDKHIVTMDRNTVEDIPVVVILASKDIDVQCDACGNCEGIEYMWYHFGGKVSEFLALQP